MTDDRPYDIVLLGCTGFTGGLTAEYLAQHAPDHRAQRLLHDFVIGDQAVGRLVAHEPLGGGGARAGQAGMLA